MRIRVGFSTAPGLLSAAIEAVTKSDVSHAFFLLDCDLGSMVYQADPRGPEVVTKTYLEETRTIVVAIEPLIDLTAAVQDSIEKYTGYRYDVGADVSDGLNLLASRVGLNWHTDFAAKHSTECAALVVRTMRFAAYPGIEKLDQQLVTPGQLLDFMQSTDAPATVAQLITTVKGAP
jgi:hypothetical protein